MIEDYFTAVFSMQWEWYVVCMILSANIIFFTMPAILRFFEADSSDIYNIGEIPHKEAYMLYLLFGLVSIAWPLLLIAAIIPATLAVGYLPIYLVKHYGSWD